jgi:hypothetical protein
MHYAIGIAFHAVDQIGRGRAIDIDITMGEAHGFSNFVDLNCLAGHERCCKMLQRCSNCIRTSAFFRLICANGVAFAR